MQDTGKKLVVFTCNETKSLDENLLDRCSRIRYYKCYKALDRYTVKLIIDDIIKDDRDTVTLLDFIMNHIKTVNYDNIISFVKEVNEGKIRKEINDVKNQACSAVANNDPETVMKLIRRIQELDHQLYDNRNDEY